MLILVLIHSVWQVEATEGVRGPIPATVIKNLVFIFTF
jgi:hypothetical protein